MSWARSRACVKGLCSWMGRSRPVSLDWTCHRCPAACSVQTFTGVPNQNKAIVLNHLIAACLSEGPSIPDPSQLHFLHPLSTPASYLLAGLPQRSFPCSPNSRVFLHPISSLSRPYSLPSCLCWVVDVSLRITQHASVRGKAAEMKEEIRSERGKKGKKLKSRTTENEPV